jgi:hypothetical protein
VIRRLDRVCFENGNISKFLFFFFFFFVFCLFHASILTPPRPAARPPRCATHDGTDRNDRGASREDANSGNKCGIRAVLENEKKKQKRIFDFAPSLILSAQEAARAQKQSFFSHSPFNGLTVLRLHFPPSPPTRSARIDGHRFDLAAMVVKRCIAPALRALFGAGAAVFGKKNK